MIDEVPITRVAHLDADAFYVSIELTRRPELRGLPVVVSGTGPRAVVTTASYEARKFGVGSAIPASRARRLCPQAVFLPPDFPTYRAVSRKVMDLVRAHVERVEVVGLDEAYLDLTGLHSPNAAMRRLIAEIKRATQLTCSVGIGPNKLVAKVASDAEKPAGFVVLTREQACSRFAQSPPGLIPGIGPKTAARLAELGLHTLAAVAAAPEEQLDGALRAEPRATAAAPCALRKRRSDRRRAQSRLGVARAHVRLRHQRLRAAERVARGDDALAVRQPRTQRAQRAHDRDQGAPRRLDHDHARAHDRGADLRVRDGRRRRAAPAAGERATASRAPARRARRRADPRRASSRVRGDDRWAEGAPRPDAGPGATGDEGEARAQMALPL